jgi:TPR repeat protein
MMKRSLHALLPFVLPALVAATDLNLRADETNFNSLLARAQFGEVSAETELGLAYCNGIGVPRDYQQAYAWLQKAAAANSPAAKSSLGWLFDKGLGVPQDDRQAFQWYLAGAKAGDPTGQDAVGGFFAAGRAVGKDDAQAASWYAKAAGQGDLDAENHLGFAYQNGWGVKKDPEKAFTYFLQAAGHNFGPAQYNVALCYWYGVFVPRDLVKAYQWCSLAVRTYPDKQADALLHQLTNTLTGAQLEAGDALVDAFTQERSGHPTAAPPPTALFASGRSAIMPFRNVVGHIVITAHLEGHANLQFMLDTGASASFIDQKTAAALNIQPSDTYTTGNGIGKELLLSAVTNPLHFGLPGLNLGAVSFRLFSTSSWDRPIGMHIDGILGTDLLKSYAIRLDYRRRTLEFMDPAALAVSQAGVPIPLDFEHSLILVQAQINKFNVESNPTGLIVDTGSNESITLSGNFFDENPQMKFSRGVSSYSLGGGGATTETITRCALLRLGDLVIRNPSVHIMLQNQGLWANGWAGSIGNDILQRFDVTINFPGRMLYLRPNSSLGQTDEYEAGLLLQAKGGISKSYVVSEIVPDTAAAQAGLIAGDVLVQVDGIALKGLSLEEARTLLRRPGMHRLVVNRDGKILSLEFLNG